MNLVFRHQRLQMAWSQIKQNNMNNFQPLEVELRGSEIQLQVGENLNNLI